MSRASAWLLASMVLVASLPARAVIVQDLYAAEVPVASQSSQALDSGAEAALAEVLVKVSGSAELLRSPAIRSALGEARSHVQQYSFRRAKSPGGELTGRFEFDGGYVTSLVIIEECLEKLKRFSCFFSVLGDFAMNVARRRPRPYRVNLGSLPKLCRDCRPVLL